MSSPIRRRNYIIGRDVPSTYDLETWLSEQIDMEHYGMSVIAPVTGMAEMILDTT